MVKFEYDEKDRPDFTLRTAVDQAIGAASACWTNLEGAGEFRSEHAKSISDALMEQIVRFTTPQPTRHQHVYTQIGGRFACDCGEELQSISMSTETKGGTRE